MFPMIDTSLEFELNVRNCWLFEWTLIQFSSLRHICIFLSLFWTPSSLTLFTFVNEPIIIIIIRTSLFKMPCFQSNLINLMFFSTLTKISYKISTYFFRLELLRWNWNPYSLASLLGNDSKNFSVFFKIVVCGVNGRASK